MAAAPSCWKAWACSGSGDGGRAVHVRRPGPLRALASRGPPRAPHRGPHRGVGEPHYHPSVICHHFMKNTWFSSTCKIQCYTLHDQELPTICRHFYLFLLIDNDQVGRAIQVRDVCTWIISYCWIFANMDPRWIYWFRNLTQSENRYLQTCWSLYPIVRFRGVSKVTYMVKQFDCIRMWVITTLKSRF